MSSIPERPQKRNRNYGLDTLSLSLVGITAFFLLSASIGGFFLASARENIEYPFLTASAIYSPDITLSHVDTPVIASKTGEKYYLASCGAAKRIKPENVISFESREEAEKAGYSPALNCAELQDVLDLEAAVIE